MPADRINPDGTYEPPGDRYSQVVSATGSRHIHVAGTVGADDTGKPAGDTMAAQTRQMLQNVGASLEAAGAEPSDVVRNTIYATDAGAFLEEGYPQIVDYFGADTLPASALIGVDHLASPEYLVEIETTAIVDE